MDKVLRLFIVLAVLLPGPAMVSGKDLLSDHLASRMLAEAHQPLGVAQVNIENFLFMPNVVLMAVGDTVRWTNGDGVAHTATSDSGAFDSGTLFPGGSFEFRFDTVGTYPYHCTIHPSMTGQVVVVDDIEQVFLPLVIRQ